MMDNVINLLHNKLELLKEILALTENTHFLGEDGDAEAYIALMENREEIMKELILIDRNLETPDGLGDRMIGNEELRREVELVKNEIRAAASQIISLDTEMNKSIPQITADLKKHMKDISAGKNINVAYQGAEYYSAYGDGAGFDKRK